MRLPRIELGSTAWKATMLTITPETLCIANMLAQKKLGDKIEIMTYFGYHFD
jgi:hypothetical protein